MKGHLREELLPLVRHSSSGAARFILESPLSVRVSDVVGWDHWLWARSLIPQTRTGPGQRVEVTGYCNTTVSLRMWSWQGGVVGAVVVFERKECREQATLNVRIARPHQQRLNRLVPHVLLALPGPRREKPCPN